MRYPRHFIREMPLSNCDVNYLKNNKDGKYFHSPLHSPIPYF